MAAKTQFETTTQIFNSRSNPWFPWCSPLPGPAFFSCAPRDSPGRGSSTAEGLHHSVLVQSKDDSGGGAAVRGLSPAGF